jgi:hypothetical protein
MTEEETTDRILAALTEGERLAGSVFAEADRMVATVRLIEGGLAALPLSTDQFGTANGHELVWLRAKKAVTVFTDRILAALTEGERLAGSVFAEADRMVATVRLVEAGLAGLPLSTDPFVIIDGYKLIWLRAKKAVTVFNVFTYDGAPGRRWAECTAVVKMATFPLLLPLVEAAVATLRPGEQGDDNETD